MTTRTATGRPALPDDGSVRATGHASFAGILMIVNGMWAFLVGIAAVFRDEAWGWVHLVLGVLVAWPASA